MPLTLDEVIQEVGEALHRKQAAYFTGAGISASSGLPDWLGLMNRLASSLDINVTGDDDLPAIAQYCQNAEVGNRGALIGRLKRHLSPKRTKFNKYHDAISKTNISTIWTTNYDVLLERLFPRERLAVRANDSDITHGTRDFDVELLKIHGCINKSAPDEFVLTKSDYEDFASRRPAMTERLRHDLLSKTMLFIGYGNQDPNIRTVAAEARRLSLGTTREHFFITKLPSKKKGQSDANYEESKKRYELWLTDLRRLGIRSVMIDSYGDLEKALYSISRVSRGKSVFVTGSHQVSEQGANLARAIGESLVQIPDVIFIDGQSAGAGRQAANAFGEACIKAPLDVRDHVQYFPNPYSYNPEFSNRRDLLSTLKQWRASLFRAAHVVVALDGGMGTEAELEVATEMRCRIVPVPLSNKGVVRALLDNPDVTENLTSEYIRKARSLRLSADDVLSCVRAIVG